MSGTILDVTSGVNFDETIIDYQYHSHNPYASNSTKNSDEIRIPIQQQDVYTLPHKSFLIIEGKILKSDGKSDETTKFINNCMAFLFDEIRYELCGTEIDRVKNVGITSTMKNLLTCTPGDVNWLHNAGWNCKTFETMEQSSSFSFCVPLKLLLGFAEDFKKILLNVKQELVLIRASTDKNALFQHTPELHESKVDITKIVWKMPYVRVEDEIKLSLLKIVDGNQNLLLPFRRWQIHEYPSLPSSTFQTWTVKASTMLEKPRYVIVGFQTGRKDQIGKNSANFDFCDLENVKLYLNSKYYPYDNINGNKSLLYDLYARFQSSYYVDQDDQPCVDKNTFLSKTPLYVIDCSKQLDSLKTGSLDIRVELQTKTAIPANTTAYCLIIHDGLVQYNPLSGIVKKIM